MCVPQLASLLAAVPRVLFLLHSICTSPVGGWMEKAPVAVVYNCTAHSVPIFFFGKTTAHIPICICIRWHTITLTAVVTAVPDGNGMSPPQSTGKKNGVFFGWTATLQHVALFVLWIVMMKWMEFFFLRNRVEISLINLVITAHITKTPSIETRITN